MNSIELKNILIHRISTINDVSFLEAIKTILDSKSESKTITLTEDQKYDIVESQKEIDRGMFIDNDQLNTEIEAWLKEK